MDQKRDRRRKSQDIQCLSDWERCKRGTVALADDDLVEQLEGDANDHNEKKKKLVLVLVVKIKEEKKWNQKSGRVADE